nr:MAG TPA: hypothetical protein [Caudoviricetes sp.]
MDIAFRADYRLFLLHARRLLPVRILCRRLCCCSRAQIMPRMPRIRTVQSTSAMVQTIRRKRKRLFSRSSLLCITAPPLRCKARRSSSSAPWPAPAAARHAGTPSRTPTSQCCCARRRASLQARAASTLHVRANKLDFSYLSLLENVIPNVIYNHYLQYITMKHVCQHKSYLKSQLNCDIHSLILKLVGD